MYIGDPADDVGDEHTGAARADATAGFSSMEQQQERLQLGVTTVRRALARRPPRGGAIGRRSPLPLDSSNLSHAASPE